MSGGFFRGTSADQDTRFSNKQAKLLKSQKFAPELENLVDMTKVKMDVMRPWIAKRVTELIGFEDEVLINFIYGLLEGKAVNGKQVQISLTGFMERNTGKFMKELWALLLSAQQNVSGVPQQFLDAKEEETKKKKAETDRIANEIQRKKEKEKQELEEEKTKMDGDGTKSRDKHSELGPNMKHDAGDEKELYKSNGRRRSSRGSQSPGSSYHSPPSRQKRSLSPNKSNSRSYSNERRRSRSISRTPPSRNRSISSERQDHSAPRQSITPRRRLTTRRSPSPWRRSSRLKHRSRSHSRRRSPSPARYRFHSPRRHRSRSPVRRRSRSPLRRRSRSPVRHRSRSPVRRRSRSPVWRRSRTPMRRSAVRYRSRTPLRRRSPSPMLGRSPSPSRGRSPLPWNRRSSSPPRHRSPSPPLHSSPSPPRRSSLTPVRHRPRSPLRHRSPSPRRQSPSHARRQHQPSLSRSISPVRRRSSMQGRKGSYAPASGRSPSLQESRSPSPIRRISLSPVRRGLEKNARSPAQSPGERVRREKYSHVRRASPNERAEIPAENCKGTKSVERRPVVSLRSPQRDTLDRTEFHRKPRDSPPSMEKSPSDASRGRSDSDEPRLISPHGGSKQRKGRIVQRDSSSPSRKAADPKARRVSSRTSVDDESNFSSREIRERIAGKISPTPVRHKDSLNIVEVGDPTDSLKSRKTLPPISDRLRETTGRKEHREGKDLSKTSKTTALSVKSRESYDGARARNKKIDWADDGKGGYQSPELEGLHKMSRKSEKNDHNGSLDSPSKEPGEHKSKMKEKRKHKKLENKDVESDDYSSYDSYEERKEAKRRRREEKKLKKEERRRRRREERRRRRDERHAEKKMLKSGDASSSSQGLDQDHSEDESVKRQEARTSNMDESESEQRKLEIELRQKALESLRAKKRYGS